MPTTRLLLFGASGAIGSAICSHALRKGWQVTAVSRTTPAEAHPEAQWVAIDPLAPGFSPAAFGSVPFPAVCWAQGANRNDSVYDVDPEANLDLYRANCLYILITLRGLLGAGLLERGSRLCIISSIWQNLARQTKLSYCMTKAALQGLVLSASVDLAQDGHLINAVLPGALDTPMTRKNLAPEQMAAITGATGFGTLPQLGDVARLSLFLLSAENTGITGQFIAADLGFSHARRI